MVKIAIAGPGPVAREIIDGLLATGRHEIVIFARKAASPDQLIPGTTWIQVDYQNRAGLLKALDGVHTALSFIPVHLDPDNASQKALIDAAIEAGVKRIAPSEWSVTDFTHLDWYNGKVEIRKYMEEKNRDRKVIEYTLFRPGWFLDYLAGSRLTTKHVKPWAALVIDHEHLRARLPDDPSNRVTYTAVRDFVNIVVKAIGYEGEWPEMGGIDGVTLSLAEEVAIGERVRGKPYEIETHSIADLKAGELRSTWKPLTPAEEEQAELVKVLVRGFLLHAGEGHASGSDEWNRIFPDYEFIGVEEYLAATLGKA